MMKKAINYLLSNDLAEIPKRGRRELKSIIIDDKKFRYGLRPGALPIDRACWPDLSAYARQPARGPTMLAHLVAICWPMLASCWPMWSQKIRKMGTAKKRCKTQDMLMVGGLSWGYVGPSWGYVGLSWGQCGPILELCWPILGLKLWYLHGFLPSHSAKCFKLQHFVRIGIGQHSLKMGQHSPKLGQHSPKIGRRPSACHVRKFRWHPPLSFPPPTPTGVAGVRSSTIYIYIYIYYTPDILSWTGVNGQRHML